jgi:hypothetical protein
VIVRFQNYEAAGIFAGRKRAEGFYAAVLDEGTGFLWGPMATGGFRVVVSEERLADESPEAKERGEGGVTDVSAILWVLFIVWAAAGLLAAGILFFRYVEIAVGPTPLLTAAVFVFVVPLIGLLLFPVLLWLTRVVRDHQSFSGKVLGALVVAWVILSIWWGLL